MCQLSITQRRRFFANPRNPKPVWYWPSGLSSKGCTQPLTLFSIQRESRLCLGIGGEVGVDRRRATRRQQSVNSGVQFVLLDGAIFQDHPTPVSAVLRSARF